MRIVSAEASVEQIRVPAKTLLTLVREEGYAAHRRDQARHRRRRGTRARAFLARGAALALAAPDHHGIHVAARRRGARRATYARSAIAKSCARTKTSPTRSQRTRPGMNDQADNANLETVTAAVLVIGDEILSGRTKDRNIGYIAEYLGRDRRRGARGARRARRRGGDRRRAQRAARALRLCVHDRRHRPDPRRHHRRLRSPRPSASGSTRIRASSRS